MTVNDRLAIVQEHYAKAARLAGQAGEEEKAAQLKSAELALAIKDGDTTGDRFFDFAIVKYGDLAGEKTEPLRRLDTNIRAHEGELALVVSTYTKREGCTGFGGKGYLVTHVEAQIGLVQRGNDGLILKLDADYHASGWGIPVSRAVGSTSRGWKLQDVSELTCNQGIWAMITLADMVDITAMDDNEFMAHYYERQSQREHKRFLDVQIGNDNVRRWHETMDRLDGAEALNQILKVLDCSLEEPTLL